jgi:diguanylate cyclase (GGDEF)-like protein/PAS domain S-box-containing protein
MIDVDLLLSYDREWLALALLIALVILLLLAIAWRRGKHRRNNRRGGANHQRFARALEQSVAEERDERTAARKRPSAPSRLAEVLEGIAALHINTRDTITYASPAALHLLGYKEEEIIGKTVERLVPPWCRNELESDGKERIERETQRLIHNNKLIDVLWISTPQSDSSGQATGARIWTMLDITERKRKESMLRLAARSMELLQDGVMITDVAQENAVIYVNAAVEQITGYSSDEILGRSPRFLYAEGRDQEGLAELNQAIRERTPCRVILHNQRKDGSYFWNELSITPVKGAGGQVSHFIGLIRDVTDRYQYAQELRQMEARERTVIDEAPIAICLVDERQVIRNVNPMLNRLFGYQANQLIGKSLFELLPEEAWRGMAPDRPGQKGGSELALQSRDGNSIVVMTNVAALDNSGSAPFFVIFMADITGRKQAEYALADERERAVVTLASIGEGVITTNEKGVVDYLNPVAERLTGWMREDILGMGVEQVFKLLDEETREPLKNPVERALRLGRSASARKALLLANDGREFSLHITATPIRDREQKIIGAVTVFRDVTETRAVERRIAKEAKYDALTGLRNRREFESLLEKALLSAREEGKQHVLGYLDLDKFKIINDTCGHAAGDEVLKQISELMESRLRSMDILSRLGGDEFAILLYACPLEVGESIAEHIRKALEEYRFVWHDRTFELSVSIGLVPLGPESASLDEVIKMADAACYTAKETGRNRIEVYHPGGEALLESASSELWLSRIKKGIEQDRFTLFARNAKTTEKAKQGPLYVEVSVRLHDEQDNLLPEGAFMPFAERYQQSLSIDEWKISTLMFLLGEKEVSDVVYALKLSTQAVNAGDQLITFITQQMERSGVVPGSLCIEVNESELTTNFTQVKKLFAALKGLGFRLAIDRFGYNRMSFGHLGELSVDFVKIDAGVTHALHDNPVDYILVEAISRVGEMMHIPVVATGVDDAQSMAEMEKLGVDYVLGAHIDSGRVLEERGLRLTGNP